MKDTPVRSENRTGVSDCSETNSLSEPQRAEPRLNILLQSAPVRSPHGFETFPLLHKNLRTGQFWPWHAASKNACGSTALSILTDENTTGLAALSPYSSFVSNGFPVGNSHRLMPGSVTFDPCRQYRNDISLFFSRQFPPGGMPCHLARHPRQQQAVACWAIKTGCPRIGVCRPSLGITAGARRVRTKSAA